MATNDSRGPKETRNRNVPPDPNFNWRGIVLFALAFALIGGALLLRSPMTVQELPYFKFQELLKAGAFDRNKPIDLVTEQGRSTQYIHGFYAQTEATPGKVAPSEFKTRVLFSVNKDLEKQITDAGYKIEFGEENNVVGTLLASFLPIALFLLVLYFLFRQQIKMAGKGALNFGKSKARMLARDKNKITFKDVAGVEEAKEEVSEIVEFLKDPKKFQKLGGHIPKGVLMVGSPGTGKTLLARAIAGEADVPFFSISGSDFVEMFVGVGASRVRDMFEQGRKSAPCLIFIDEIDAVGRHRGHGMGGGHDEREQTLNAMLVEMDGFDAQEGVIIIAATNRADVLDPALLRPGRFDRQVVVPLPDVKGREEILRVHAKKVKIAEGTQLDTVARGTPGFSGAELANVINEAALLAARRGLKAITLSELEEARDKVRFGRERRSLAMSNKEKENTAYHEAGHALLGILLKHVEPLHKVTIIPRGPALGVTMFLPLEDKYTSRKQELLESLIMTMGGRIAEELIFGDVTNGASGDIRQATAMARKMVCDWGMSEKMGMVGYSDSDEGPFMGGMGKARNYSEATALEIDLEVRKLCDDAYARAKELIIQHRDKLEIIARALLEFETLTGEQTRDIVETGSMRNPPPPIVGTPLGGEDKGPRTSPPEIVIAPDFPGGMTGQPA
jgi:cell division protease FtsH